VLAKADTTFRKLAQPARFEGSARVAGPIVSGPLTTTLQPSDRPNAWSEGVPKPEIVGSRPARRLAPELMPNSSTLGSKLPIAQLAKTGLSASPQPSRSLTALARGMRRAAHF
jgi:hypothetical protein